MDGTLGSRRLIFMGPDSREGREEKINGKRKVRKRFGL
jgi:hypothetical protein